MGDYRDDLRREVERHRVPDDMFARVSKRRDRRRRNRQVGTALIAVVIAAAGSFGLYRAFGGAGEPGVDPSITPSIAPSPGVTTPAPTAVSPSPSLSPPVIAAMPPEVSGPIQFVDALHGWMASARGEISATTDGGGTWTTTVYSGTHVSQVDFVDGQHGWGLTDGGFVRTSDGGASWDVVATKTLDSVQFLTTDSGWGIEKSAQRPENVGRLVQTTDGGATWTTPPAAPEVNSVCFATESLGWAAGPHEAGAAVFRTDDGGLSWSEVPVPIPGGDQGWTATVRCTADGPWLVVTGGGAAGHIAFVVFRLDDAGPHAVLQEAGTHPMGEDQAISDAANPSPGPLVALDGATAAVVTACPPCGGDSASVSFESTQDGGSTWGHPTVFGSSPPAEPLGVSFVDREHGWVLLSVNGGGGSDDTVLATTDGGQTWAAP